MSRQACTCPSGKHRFDGYHAAERALRAARRRNRCPHNDSFAAQTVRLTRLYPCELCRGWHLTSDTTPRPASLPASRRSRTAVSAYAAPTPTSARAELDALGPRVARWIALFVTEHGHGPSWAETGRAMQWTRGETATLLPGLRRRGWIWFTGTARSLRPMPGGSATSR